MNIQQKANYVALRQFKNILLDIIDGDIKFKEFVSKLIF